MNSQKSCTSQTITSSTTTMVQIVLASIAPSLPPGASIVRRADPVAANGRELQCELRRRRHFHPGGLPPTHGTSITERTTYDDPPSYLRAPRCARVSQERRRVRAMKAVTDGPLHGVRVLDITTMFSGAFGATMMGDFGADVIKVELPGRGDTVRGMSPSAHGVPLPWTTLARNKRTITLDIRKPAGRELLLKLVGASDVLIENFRPGTLDRWDLSYETLKAANPGIIVVRVSGYGQTGPYASKAGFGT